MEETKISFETAKLAKEKGFKLPTFYYYNKLNLVEPFLENGSSTDCDFKVYLTDLLDNHNIYFDYYSAPTQSLLQKWLREVHNIHITIYSCSQESWMYRITKKGQSLEKGLYGEDFENYEEALEAGLQEALKMLKSE